MKQFQIYQDAMESRFWSSGFGVETNEATDSVFTIEGKTGVKYLLVFKCFASSWNSK